VNELIEFLAVLAIMSCGFSMILTAWNKKKDPFLILRPVLKYGKTLFFQCFGGVVRAMRRGMYRLGKLKNQKKNDDTAKFFLSVSFALVWVVYIALAIPAAALGIKTK